MAEVEPAAPSRLDGLRRLVRLLGWSLSLGLGGTLLHAALVVRALVALDGTSLSPSALQALLTLLEPTVLLALSFLAGLLVELPLACGAAGGIFAVLLGLLTRLAIGGAAAWVGSPRAFPILLLQALLCAAAGAAGLWLSRRLVRRRH